jgi:hypothetical protein
MNEVITGASLKANTSGEAGFTVKPLPSCLETDDWRGLLNADGTLAPRGTASIPASGNFCQGCHIRRHMAAGAIAFRPFGLIGEVMSFDSVKQLYDDKDDATKTAALKRHESALQELLVEAFAEDGKWRRYKERSNKSEPVKLDLDFFKRLMNVGTEAGQEKGCVLERESASETPIVVTQVSDLAQFLIKDDAVLARGLSRIIPRAVADVSTTNSEVIEALDNAWKAGDGKLFPMFRAYFSTETFACRPSKEEGQ